MFNVHFAYLICDTSGTQTILRSMQVSMSGCRCRECQVIRASCVRWRHNFLCQHRHSSVQHARRECGGEPVRGAADGHHAARWPRRGDRAAAASLGAGQGRGASRNSVCGERSRMAGATTSVINVIENTVDLALYGFCTAGKIKYSWVEDSLLPARRFQGTG